MKKKGWAGFLRQKQYVIAGALVVIAAIGTTALYSNQQEKERQQMEAELAEEISKEASETEAVAAEEETEDFAEASSVIPPKSIEDSAAAPEMEVAEVEEEPDETEATDVAEEPAAETSSTTQTLHFAPENGILWPMDGNVIINYSMDATVYFPTLDQYKYNPAIIIEGEVNDKVYSVAKGKVQTIENNEETGCTVTVELGDGYQAIYGQLKELNFEEGDYVEAGHVIGYISEPTKYYSVEGSNLYFALQKDGSPIDPIDFLNDLHLINVVEE